MQNLIVLEAFKDTRKEKIEELLRTIDVESGNKMMRMLSGKYGFPVVAVAGVLRTTLEYVRLAFDYEDRKHLPKVWRKYDIETPKVFESGIENHPRMRSELGLKPTDHWSLLPGWKEILVAGIYGRGEHAEEIKNYLLGMESVARAEIHTEQHYKKSLREHVQHVLKEPISGKEIIEKVSKNTITISKERYIEFLEIENKVLRLQTKRLSIKKNPLRPLEISQIIALRSSRAKIKDIAARIGRSPYAVWKCLKSRGME